MGNVFIELFKCRFGEPGKEKNDMLPLVRAKTTSLSYI